MNKYAVCVGINKYENGNNLRGCVNDINDIRERLIKKYQFEPDNIRLLSDSRATKKAICEHIEWLVSCCDPVAEDLLVLHYSGHGTKFRIRRGANLDNFETACLCPTDMNWDDPLSADVLHRYVDQIPPNTSLSFIADCCNSGNLVRELSWSSGVDPSKPLPKRMIPPADILARSLDRTLTTKQIEDYVSIIDSVNVLFLSGCTPEQTSADAYIGGRYNGALTAGLKTVIDNVPTATWEETHDMLLKFMVATGFDQRPVLKGSTHTLTEKLFLGGL
jgi:hypothetical protein